MKIAYRIGTLASRAPLSAASDAFGLGLLVVAIAAGFTLV